MNLIAVRPNASALLVVLLQTLKGRENRILRFLSFLKISRTLLWSWKKHQQIPLEWQAEVQKWLELYVAQEEKQAVYKALTTSARKARKRKNALKKERYRINKRFLVENTLARFERKGRPCRRVPKIVLEANQLIEAQKGSLQSLLTTLQVSLRTYQGWQIDRPLRIFHRSILRGWVNQIKLQDAMAGSPIGYALLEELEELRKLEQIHISTLVGRLRLDKETYSHWLQKSIPVPLEAVKRIQVWIFKTRSRRTRLYNEIVRLLSATATWETDVKRN